MDDLLRPPEGINDEKLTFKDSTFEIVSKVAYLLGVPKRVFESDSPAARMEDFEALEMNKNARIIRDLCILRTSIERNFKRINDESRSGLKSIFSLPEYVPQECISRLMNDGISLSRKPGKQLSNYVVEINKYISDRINNCKSLFPIWLNWQYLRDIFIMPGGLSDEGTKEAADFYYAKMDCYPYRMYMNWPASEQGNILYNDKKFVTLLYSWHNEEFKDFGKVSDVGSFFKNSIYDFISESQQVVIVVDCENVDPYKLCAALRGLSQTALDKISSIILFDDIHASSGWDLLHQFTSIPVEHNEIERVKENKSLVDMKLALRVSQEFYEKQVDSYVLVSSDSDYWALISSLPKAHFLVMVEHDKCGQDLKKALTEHGIFYCYLDDFYTGNTEDLKQKALFREMAAYLERTVHVNLNTMLDLALYNTRVTMTDAERKQFYNKYLKSLQMNIAENGDVTLAVKVK